MKFYIRLYEEIQVGPGLDDTRDETVNEFVIDLPNSPFEEQQKQAETFAAAAAAYTKNAWGNDCNTEILPLEEHIRKLEACGADMNIKLAENETPSWVEKHSVNCYFCGKLFDEREGVNGDRYTHDGGTLCKDCIPAKDCECPNCHSGTIGLEDGHLVCRGECGCDFGEEN